MGGTCETPCCGDEQIFEPQNVFVEEISDKRVLQKHKRLRSEKTVAPQSSYRNLLTTHATDADVTPPGPKNKSSIHLTEEFESMESSSSNDEGDGFD